MFGEVSGFAGPVFERTGRMFGGGGMIPILRRIKDACEGAAEAATEGDLAKRHALLVRAQKDLTRFEDIAARVLRPDQLRDLLPLDECARRYMELANVEGIAIYAEHAADLVENVSAFWDYLLTEPVETGKDR
jgi:hypothetical protein